MIKLNNKQLIAIIFLLGLTIRILFLLFGAEIYFGRADFYIRADTSMFVDSIVNFIEYGSFSGDLSHEDGYFLRTPGYPFFIGIFYLLSGKDLPLTYQLIIWAQVFFDALCVIIIYKIGAKIFSNSRISILLSLIYATYPFIIVWNPVVYAESISVFFLLVSILYFVNKGLKYNYFYSGIFISIALLTRPQIALLLPCYFIALVYCYRSNLKIILIPILQLALGCLLLYAPWPIRNYINHNRVVFFQNYGAVKTLSPDIVAFWNYIFALKAEWEPQFSNIIHNKEVTFPKDAYIVPGDSIKLARAVQLAKTCGAGFSRWRGYWKEPISDTLDCNDEIVKLFNELRDNQIKYNWLNYYLIAPLKNLKKSLFKSNLYSQDTLARKLASYLFFYRTLLIILGFAGIFLIIRNINKPSLIPLTIVVLTYSITWYLYMAFIHRNIEIRYLLPVDVLLLLPASFCIYQIGSFIKRLFAL